MQKTELAFILQAYNPLSRKWTDICYNRCRIKRNSYFKAKEHAEKILTVFDNYEGTYRIIKRYMPVQKQNIEQLQLGLEQ